MTGSKSSLTLMQHSWKSVKRQLDFTTETMYLFAKSFSMTFWEQQKLTKTPLLYEHLKRSRSGMAFAIAEEWKNEL